MRFMLCAAGVFAGVATAVADPTRALAPDDPSYESGWRPTASPTSGLKSYRPVEAKNWLQLNQNAGGGMGAMPGMKSHDMKSMPGMKDMPGMGGGK